MRGPVAPKDPTKKRPKIFFLFEDNIVMSSQEGDSYQEVIYLEGRVKNKIQLICPEISDDIAGRFQDSTAFFENVYGLGITVEAESPEDKEESVVCELMHYATTDKYGDGTRMQMEVCADGAERVFPLSEYQKKDVDDVLGTLFFRSTKKGLSAKATIVLYLNDGITVPEPQMDPPIGYDKPEYVKMLGKSTLSLGNTFRLNRVIEKAKRGEKVTIAFIGGSVTQGAGAKPIESKSYAYLTKDGFAKMFGCAREQVKLIKAGVGGTSSEFGVLRYQRDVLRNKTVEPDLVIIEFAVNDEGDETNGICYESLVNLAYQQPNEPAVVLLFAVFMNDFNLQDRLSPIGFHYQLPMVSIKDAVCPQFVKAEERVITKRQFFYDCFHPSNDGHRIMAECVLHLFEQVDASMPKPEWPKEACLGRQFAGVKTISREITGEELVTLSIQLDHGSFAERDSALQAAEFDEDSTSTKLFTNNWMRPTKCNNNAPFVVRLTCRCFFLIFMDSGSNDAGIVTVYVNGRETRTLNPKEIGWGHCHAALIMEAEEEKMVEIKVSPKPDEIDKFFTILGFGYTR